MRKLVAALLVLLAVAAAGSAGGSFYLYHQFASAGSHTTDQRIIIKRGAGLRGIAHRLTEAGIVSNPWYFILPVRLLGQHQQLRAGEYLFPSGISPYDAYMMMLEGDIVIRQFTVPEGHTSSDIEAILNALEEVEGEPVTAIREGSLLPETYHYEHGDTRDAIVQRMQQMRHDVLDALWEKRQRGLPIASPTEAVILASIVEKETGIASERPQVAAVFINRLRRGMKLQSDPTVIYAITEGKSGLGRALLRKDLEGVDSPYNTYRYAGLPPGPICHPGKASLEAVLNPVPSEALYFVADGKGGHVFAATLDEHNRNVRAYRTWLKQQKQ